MKKAGVIGAGIAGIASAIRLANQGYEVSVFEGNAYAGGKLSEIRQAGFRFDAGPSLFTMPEEVVNLFQISGKNYKDYFDFEQLSLVTRYFYEDGTQLDALANKSDFIKEVKNKLGADTAQHISDFFEKSKELYDITAHVFLHKSLHKLSTYFNWDTFQSILKLHKIDAFRTVNQANEKWFSHPKLVQLFNRYATYNGSNPYQAPATLNIIPYLEHELGAFFPKGGMYEITKSLKRLAEELGIQFHFSTPAQQILLKNNKVTGLQVNNEKLDFDLLVSNVDIVNTYRKLLPQTKAPEFLLKQPKSSSALIFYWGIDRSFPELDLHNIFFSENYQEEFNYLFQTKSIFEDPTVYLYISSKQNASDAPVGSENWFTMINVPNNSGQNWEQLTQKAKLQIQKKLSRILGVEIKNHIVCEEILDPVLIESKTSSFQGALYGNSSNNKFAAFLRHPNFSQKIKNLYFCGGSVHPGGGIPLCLLSAKIVGNLVQARNI